MFTFLIISWFVVGFVSSLYEDYDTYHHIKVKHLFSAFIKMIFGYIFGILTIAWILKDSKIIFKISNFLNKNII
jgi:hypothetical protein